MPENSAVLDKISPRPYQQVAALDIGSNSFHLVVARIVADNVQILHRVKQKVRMADGLDKQNRLSEDAIQRGLDALTIVAESIRGFEPDTVRIVATYTLRKAKNAKEFLKRAKQIVPYPIEIVSGIEEARLIYSGVAHTVQDHGQRLVIDIGGGSTEFIIGQGFDAKLLRSLQMGCVSFTSRYFSDGKLDAQRFKKAITGAQQELELIDSKYLKLGWQHCIGTSGTIKAIMLLSSSLDSEIPEGFITLDGLKRIRQACIEAGHIDNLKFSSISEDRQPVLAAGLSILIAIFKSLKILSMEYSGAALREGVIYEMEEQLAQNNIRERTAQSLATRYDVDIEQAKRVHNTSMDLFDKIRKPWKFGGQDIRNTLSWAALLHEVGMQINTRGVQRHSSYILQNVDLFGFNQEQQLLLALLVRFHRKRIRVEEFNEFWQYDSGTVIKLMILLRLAVLLNIKRQSDILPEYEVMASGNNISIHFANDWLSGKPIFSADLLREKNYLAEVGYELTFD